MIEYYFAKGTIALAGMIAMEESKVEFEAREIFFADQQQQSADYLKVNPKGRVPALIYNGKLLTEMPAILQFVSQIGGQSPLSLPGDAFEVAKINSLNSFICSTLHVAHAHRMRGHRWVDDEAAKDAMRKKVPETVTAAFKHIEDEYLDGPWVMGETYTISDPYLFTVAQWLEGDSADLSVLPKVVAHRDRMKERPAVQSALAIENQ